MGTMGRLVSLNVGIPQPIEWLGQRELSAIWKFPVEGKQPVRGVNVVGDDQADRSVHGGREKAIYSYAVEDEAWWAVQLGREIGPGTFGENLSLEGIDVTNAVIGERWQVGSVVLEVCQPRIPCWKLAARMNDAHFPQKFGEAGRPGAYLRIIEEGEIEGGDEVTVVSRPDGHSLTVRDVARIYHSDHDEWPLFLQVPELAETWKRWAHRRKRYSKYK